MMGDSANGGVNPAAAEWIVFSKCPIRRSGSTRCYGSAAVPGEPGPQM